MTQQFSLFQPRSKWLPPRELPDLSSAELIGLDVETCDPNLLQQGPGGVRNDGRLVGISVATDTGFKGYFPIGHEGGDNLDRDAVLAWARALLGGTQTKVGANLLYDLEWLRATGIEVGGSLIDIQVAEPLINEERQGSFSLDALAGYYLGKQKDETLLNEAAQAHGVDPKSGLWKMPARFVGPYAEADAQLPLEIWQKQEKIISDKGLWKIFELESKLLRVILDMRFKGVPIDLDKAQRLAIETSKEEDQTLSAIYQEAEFKVSPWSALELAEAFNRLKIWYPKTEKGNPSFTSYWLNNHTHPFAKKIAHYRKINKMRRDFIEGLCLKMSHKGRIYAQFHSLRKDSDGTRSGRFSSSTPNLQQIPARDEHWGPLIRSLFLPEEGMKWACLDYSQQEPKVLMHYAYLRKLKGSQDAVQMYLDNPDTDFHQMVADMAKIKRKQAKTINLGMFYGMGPYKLSQTLDMSLDDAKPLFEQYHQRVPFVRQLAHECTMAINHKGHIRTLLGRHRHLPRDFNYKALNALIQGSSADMIKKAMIDLHDIGVVPHVTVHDELDFSVHNEKEATVYKEVMESCVPLVLPLKVDVEIGPNWGEIK